MLDKNEREMMYQAFLSKLDFSEEIAFVGEIEFTFDAVIYVDETSFSEY